ncbi:4052_t:CDS:2 [Funneliformis caledonium]|uniref:4052_t:CDS:1 n=1 Tax=Funneliformis caledonium TaxID=1117310 RepID=A0A9N9GMP3_9GLOM|nr:4052_t:CDS:2 [Funneliformis caledonium]
MRALLSRPPYRSYQHLNINWYATSFYINDNVASAYTSYEASAI